MKLQHVILLGIFFITGSLWAAQELVFRKQTQVYSKPNIKSDSLTVYERGDRVPVSNENYGAWKKIIAEVDGKKQIGWVLVRDIKGARIQEKDTEKVTTSSGKRKKLEPVYRKKIGVGVAGVLSYYKQGSGSVDLNNTVTTSLNFSDLDGTGVYFSIFGDMPLTSKLNLRGYFSMRNLERSGTGTFPPDTQSRSINIDQTALSLGSTLKFYSHTDGNSWWGPGVELAMTDKSDVTASNATTTFKDDPLYIFIHLALGYDIRFFSNVFILPEFRIGAAVNGDPFILNAEILIPIAYRF